MRDKLKAFHFSHTGFEHAIILTGDNMNTMLQSFGSSLRFLLSQKGLSAEELVDRINHKKIVTTNKSAISRVMTGKRMPTEEEVKEIAEVLETPLLLEEYTLIGRYLESKDGTLVLAFQDIVDRIHGGDDHSQGNSPAMNYTDLYQMSKNLFRHSLTHDVSKPLKEGFLISLYHVSGCAEMVSRLRAMYLCYFNSSDLSKKERAWLASALLYFMNPFDLIPDFTALSGYMDDTVVVSFVFMKLSSKLLPFLDKYKEVDSKGSDLSL